MLRSVFIAILALSAAAFLGCDGAAQARRADGRGIHPFGPGSVPADDFRTDGDRVGKPVRGGRLTVHVATRPLHLNTVITASAETRRILEELHARLLERDWETWEMKPSLARSITVGDWISVKPVGDRVEDGAADSLSGNDESQEIQYGEVSELEPASAGWCFVPVSASNERGTPQRIPSSQVTDVQLGAVFTLHLRENVLWHDGHPFDAEDVIFSIDTYLNRHVQSEHARHRFERLRHYEALDKHTLRIVFERTYFLSLDLFEDELTILPRHLFDLTDPDNPDYEPEASAERRAEFIHQNPANVNWVGLGPYRLTEFTDQFIDAERFDDYFDQTDAGWADAIRWRIIPDDNAAKLALLAGELDFFGRLRSRELLGEFCQQPAFCEQYEKGFYYTPEMSYIAWNMRRPLFQDERVRRALAHCFDWQEFIDTIGSAMGQAVTATWYCFSPDYDSELKGFPFDLDRAEELLAEAGWFDRDGDGVIDRDGQRFEFEYLYATPDAAMRLVGQKLKENLRRIGIVMNMTGRDFATRQEIVGERDFDAAAMHWVMGPETDPVGIWHSDRADLPRSNNQPGYKDARSDALIEAIRGELDDDVRRELFHQLQRRIYAAQPYMFGCVFPTKFAVSKRVRGVQRFFLDPGYSVRRWYIEPDADPDSETAIDNH